MGRNRRGPNTQRPPPLPAGGLLGNININSADPHIPRPRRQAARTYGDAASAVRTIHGDTHAGSGLKCQRKSCILRAALLEARWGRSIIFENSGNGKLGLRATPSEQGNRMWCAVLLPLPASAERERPAHLRFAQLLGGGREH